MSTMRIVVAGGSGFLGRALIASLRRSGHTVSVLTRHPRAAEDVRWSPSDASTDWWSVVREAGAIVNLAGESLMGKRWTPRQKAAIRESRVAATSALVRAIVAAPRPPILVNGSAVGVYGPHGDEPLTEGAPPGSGFLAEVCTAWEAAALDAARSTRVVVLRTGVVLSREGGALPQLALPFRLFVGGRVGSGRQYLSWIHLDDWVSLAEWVLLTASVSGPVNATAPVPVTNAELASALGTALGRPAFVPTPGFAVRLALGEMADDVILTGQRVLPARAQALGFEFRYKEIGPALASIYR
jgi:uncharacterized protein (TIGR01777 family)